MHNNRRFLRVLTALLAVVFLLTMGTSALAASFQARINSSSAKVHKSPSTSSKYVTNGKNIRVTVTGYSGSWARVKYQGYTGYTLIKNLELVNRLKGYTTKSTAVYKSASSSSKLGTLPKGSTVYVIGMNGSYYQIENASGSVTGYVYKSNLSKKKPATTTSQSSSSSSSSSSSGTLSGGSSSSSSSQSKIEKVISKALGYVGRPYGSNAPSSFNCSSLVKYCMESQGYSMLGNAVSQAGDSRYAKITSLASVKRGDILCFDTDEDGVCDHTAIATSATGASFVEASQKAGKVQTNTMTSWYKQHFLWARRPA